MFAVSNKNPAPKITETLVSDRTDTGANLKVEVSQNGTLYYMVKSVNEPAPSYEEILKGTQVEVKAGENTIALTGLTADAAKVYVMVQNASGKASAIASVEIPASKILGDMNGDGKLDFFDFNALLKAAVNGEENSSVIGDLNGDGIVNFVDANLLQKQLTDN